MPIDIHVRVAAWLHIVMGGLAAAVLLFIGLAFGAFGAFIVNVAHDPAATGVFAWLGGMGAIFLSFFIGLAVLEIAGAAMLLNGSTGGRILTILFSVLALLNFPIGTAVGVYSLWALLRTVPPVPVPVAGAAVPATTPVPSNGANPF